MLTRPVHSFNGFQGISRRGRTGFVRSEGLGSSVPMLGVGVGSPNGFGEIGEFWERVTPWDTEAEKKKKRRAAKRKRRAEEKAFQEQLAQLQAGSQAPTAKTSPVVLLAITVLGLGIIYSLRK